jgi:UDP-glucose 4-epimerase
MSIKKAIVTGGTGFIGSHIVDRLIDMGCDVVIIDRTDNPKNFNSKAKLFKGDITKLDPSAEIPVEFAGTDVIFHCAAMARVQPSIDNPIPYHNCNVNGTLNMLMVAKALSINRFVYSASSSCYGDTKIIPTPETAPLNPISPYAIQKLIGEQYCKLFSEIYNLDTVCLRYFNVYGDRMPLSGAYSLVMSIFKEQADSGNPLTITNDGKQRRDFTHISDVVEANILAATYDKKLNGEVFNIGNGNSYSINEIADMIGGEKKYGEKRLEPFETLADNTKARDILGWEPRGNIERYIKENY